MSFARDLHCTCEIAAEILLCFPEFLIGKRWVDGSQSFRIHEIPGMSTLNHFAEGVGIVPPAAYCTQPNTFGIDSKVALPA